MTIKRKVDNSTMSSNSPELSRAELEARLANSERELEQLRRAKRRVGLSFHRVPETGTQIEALTDGFFPYFKHVPACSYTLADRHGDETAKGSPLSESTDGNITLIEGDNLPVLTALQQTHRNRVDVIYIDPPYNTGNNDFIYNDARVSSVAEIEGISLEDYEKTLDGNARTVGKDDPERHSLWLSFMERRLFLAKELLSESGVIFVSIDDNEQARLKLLMDEVFGISNFVSNMIWKSKSGGANDSAQIATDHEYIICYAKNIKSAKLLLDKESTPTSQYNLTDPDGKKYALRRLDQQTLGYVASLDFPIYDANGNEYTPEQKTEIKKARWRWSKATVSERFDELVFKNGKVYTKFYEKTEGYTPRSLLVEERFGRSRTGSGDLKAIINNFSYPKPVRLMKYLLGISATQNAIILDFFAGSGTTAQAVAELNKEDGGSRQCILVTHGDENGKNIAEDVTAERIRRVLSGKNWEDKKIHESLPGELNYYRLAFATHQSDLETYTEALQSNFVGYAALEYDVVASPAQPNSDAFVVMKNSKKMVVVVTDTDYLWNNFEEFSEILTTLKVNSEDVNYPLESIVCVPSTDEFDSFGFSEIGWKYTPFPITALNSHAKLIRKMKANGTLIPVLKIDLQIDEKNDNIFENNNGENN